MRNELLIVNHTTTLTPLSTKEEFSLMTDNDIIKFAKNIKDVSLHTIKSIDEMDAEIKTRDIDRGEAGLRKYSTADIGTYTIQQRMENFVHLHEKMTDYFGCEIKAAEHLEGFKHAWGVTDEHLFRATPIGKALTSKSQLKKIRSFMNACTDYNLNLVDRVQRGEMLFREGYRIASNIRKMREEDCVRKTMEVKIDDKAISELREELSLELVYKSNEQLEEMIKTELTSFLSERDYFKVVITDPLAEYKQYFNNNTTLLN